MLQRYIYSQFPRKLARLKLATTLDMVTCLREMADIKKMRKINVNVIDPIRRTIKFFSLLDFPINLIIKPKPCPVSNFSSVLSVTNASACLSVTALLPLSARSSWAATALV